MQLRLTIDRSSDDVIFTVLHELNEDIILGLPWLPDNQATLDYARGCVHFGQKHRRTVYWRVRTSDASTVHIYDLQHDFPEDDEPAFYQVMERFTDVLNRDDSKHTGSKSVTHVIHLITEVPVKTAPYRVSDTKNKIIEEQVQEMVKMGIIEPSTSPYTSPVEVVPKKNGKPRFCFDYRKLNGIIASEPAPMPIIGEVLRDVKNAKYFTTIDLKNGYWQIPMHPKSVEATAFTTPNGGHYNFL